MSTPFVLDAWALLAMLQEEEPAASRVRELLQDAQKQRVKLLLSIINLGEVYYRIGKVRGLDEAEETLADIRRLPLTILSATDEVVLAAARFKSSYAISYADAFAAAVTEQYDAILVTGDPELELLEGHIRLEKLHRDR